MAQFSSFAVRLAAFYSAFFLLLGCYLPYFPVWLDGRGLTPREIAAVIAVPLVVRAAAIPSIAFAADHWGDYRKVLIALACAACGALACLYPSTTFAAILAVTICYAVVFSAIGPLTEAMAMARVRATGLDYGRVRLWGSLTFVAANVLGGAVIGRFGSPAVLALLLIGGAGLVCAAIALPRPAGRGRLKSELGAPNIRWREAAGLLRAPAFLAMLATGSAVQASHAAYYAFGTIHWRAQGIGPDTIGALWAIGVVAEIVLFAFSGPVVRAIGPVRLYMLAGLAAVVRWSLTALDPPLALLFPLQALHGLTFGAAHLAAVHFISAAVPARIAATAQGLYASLAVGATMGLVTWASGPLYEAVGGGAFFAMAGLGAIGLAAALALGKLWDGGVLYPDVNELG